MYVCVYTLLPSYVFINLILFIYLFILRQRFALVTQAGVQCRDLTATFSSWVPAILLPQPPE